MPSNRPRIPCRFMVAAALALSLGAVHAQDGQNSPANTKASTATYAPTVGQSGKDVVWVPTPQSLVDQMLRMAAITPQDYLVDLGSGDGRTVITAAKLGTRAHGVEFNPDMVRLSRQAARQAGVADLATFTEGDIFRTDFSDATVVTLFLLPELNLRLRPILLDMKPGTRVVSNSFDMGDWEADESVDAGSDCKSYCSAYMWIVPARVGGRWGLDDTTSLTLDQTFQKLTGYLATDGQRHAIRDAAMQGTLITFSANGKQYKGEVVAGQMTVRDSNGSAWTATRK